MLRIEVSSSYSGPANFVFKVNPSFYEAKDKQFLNELNILHGSNINQKTVFDDRERIMRWNAFPVNDTAISSIVDYFKSIEGESRYFNFRDISNIAYRWPSESRLFFDWRKARVKRLNTTYRSGGQLKYDIVELQIQPEEMGSIVGQSIIGDVTINGSLKVGDGGTTNYTEIKDDGELSLYGTATVWEDIRVPVNSTRKSNAKPPTEGAFLTTFIIEWFSASAENELFFTVQLPHNYKEGTDLKPHVHWTPSNTDTGTVNWIIDYTWSNYDETFPASASVSITDAGSGIVGNHQISSSATLTGTGKEISSMIVCRISRDGGVGVDDFTGTAGLLEVDFHYEIDSLGSDTESVK